MVTRGKTTARRGRSIKIIRNNTDIAEQESIDESLLDEVGSDFRLQANGTPKGKVAITCESGTSSKSAPMSSTFGNRVLSEASEEENDCLPRIVSVTSGNGTGWNIDEIDPPYDSTQVIADKQVNYYFYF